MTVEQLIEALKEFPPYRVVYVGEKPIYGVREVQSDLQIDASKPHLKRYSVVRVAIT